MVPSASSVSPPDMPHPFRAFQRLSTHDCCTHGPSTGTADALGLHTKVSRTPTVCARRSSSQHHLGRALVEGRPGIGALDCLTELDAPFPDGWPPPFPIGFAFFCLSLLSLHSLALARRGQRALSLEPGEEQWLLRHLLFEKVLMLLRLSARAQRAGSAVEARVWTCMRCCCAVCTLVPCVHIYVHMA